MKNRTPGTLRLPLNPKLVKQIQGADYIDATTAARLMDEAFGEGGWSFVIDERWTNDIVGKDIIFNVRGHITVGDITKSAMASTSFKSKAVRGPKKDRVTKKIVGEDPRKKDLADLDWDDIIPANLDSIWKQTATDCFKKCASLYGVAQELYGKGNEPVMMLHDEPKFTKRQLNLLIDVLGHKWGVRKDTHELNTLVKILGFGRSWTDINQCNVDQFVRAADAFLSDAAHSKEQSLVGVEIPEEDTPEEK